MKLKISRRLIDFVVMTYPISLLIAALIAYFYIMHCEALGYWIDDLTMNPLISPIVILVAISLCIYIIGDIVILILCIVYIFSSISRRVKSWLSN